VKARPELSALQIMQEVGKRWRALTEEEKLYFKDKSDRDKVRYLKEQKNFYDEADNIGTMVP